MNLTWQKGGIHYFENCEVFFWLYCPVKAQNTSLLKKSDTTNIAQHKNNVNSEV